MEKNIVQMILACNPKKIAKTILFPAEEFVQNKIIQKLMNVKKYGKIYSGNKNGLDFSVVNSGIGAPSAAIIMEALARANVQLVVRLDYCGATSEDIEIGDIVISPMAICGDGTTPHYIEAINNQQINGDLDLTNYLINQFKQTDLPFHVGPVYSHDALFREPNSLIEKIKGLGAIAIDMESSIIFTLGKLYNISTTAIMIVTDNPAKNQRIFEMKTFSSKIFQNLDDSIDLILNSLIQLQKQK